MNTAMQAPLQEIGSLMAETVGKDGDGAFLYAEVEPGAISWGVFIDRGADVDYFYINDRLDDALVSLWRAAEPGKKWSGLAYAIVQGSMDVQFYYEDGWKEGEAYFDRSERILAQRYGNKPIKYPPPPSDAIEL